MLILRLRARITDVDDCARWRVWFLDDRPEIVGKEQSGAAW